MTIQNSYCTARSISRIGARVSFLAAALLAASAGLAEAGDLIETRWIGAIDGPFWESKYWTAGLPGSNPDINYHAIFDAQGPAYTVHIDRFDLFENEISFSKLTVNSADATFAIFDSHYEMIETTDELNLLQGTLWFQGGGLQGAQPGTRLNLTQDFRFILSNPNAPALWSTLQNYDVFGGDLLIETDIDDDDHLFRFFDSHMREGALILQGDAVVHVNSTIDYDIRFEPDTDLAEFRTGELDIEIAEHATISGTHLLVSGATGRLPFTHTGWFINHGTLHHQGGQGTLFRATNLGTLRVSAGDFQVYDANDGLMEVNQGGHLFTTIYLSGDNSRSYINRGTIDIQGEGSTFSVIANGDRYGREDLWHNEGTIRVTDSGTLRLSAMNIDALGTLQRDSSATIQLTDYLYLNGATIDRNSFGGELVLESTVPGSTSTSNPNGIIYGGKIDIAGDWLKSRGEWAGLSHTEVINGNLVVGELITRTATHSGTRAVINLDEVSIRDGDLLIGHNADVKFWSMDGSMGNDGITYFNERIRTTTNLEVNAQLWVNTNQLWIGKDSVIEASVDFRGSGGSVIRLFNEGQIRATAQTGTVSFLVGTENRGTISAINSGIGSSGTFQSFGTLLLDNSTFLGYDLTNGGLIQMLGNSSIRANFNFMLTEDSMMQIVASTNNERISVNRTLTLDGDLVLDLSLTQAEGEYQLFQAQTFTGNFDSISIIGLGDGLLFEGLNSKTGTFTIIKSCPADLNDDGTLDFFDISAFLTAFSNQDPIADFNGDTNFDFFDISAFLTAFGDGCP